MTVVSLLNSGANIQTENEAYTVVRVTHSLVLSIHVAILRAIFCVWEKKCNFTQSKWFILRHIGCTQVCSLGSNKGSAYSMLAVATTAVPIPLTLHSIYLAELCKQ